MTWGDVLFYVPPTQAAEGERGMTEPQYIGHRPEKCRQCGRGYYDGGKGFWCCGERSETEQLRDALKQLLDEVIAAGFESATDYNWPKAISDAQKALEQKGERDMTLIADNSKAIREALRCIIGTHDMNPLGWCDRCGYSPPGRKKIIWTDFETGKPVNNPWERRR